MEMLRHVQTNTSIQLPSPRNTWWKNSSRSTNIRALSSISPTSCTEKMFIKIPRLQKLGIRGKLSELLEEKQDNICLFNNLQMLKCLENLKLYSQDENALKVPMLHKFACRLRKLTFSKTFFKWDDIKILGSLEELEVLKLDENAFRGEHWDIKEDVVFKQLQYLRIGRTDLETWTAIENSFPVLESLVLRNCTDLEAIPFAFAKVHSLKVIELYHVSEMAANSAAQIDKQRREKENVKGLNLVITPLPLKAIPALVVQDDIVVGLDDEVKNLIDYLTRGSDGLTVVSIVGMLGVGKTTLAKIVFNHSVLQYEFFTRIWVHVSRSCDRRQIFLDILNSLTKRRDEEYHNIAEEQLALRIEELLRGGKYFIVMDDIWRTQDWDNLKIAFPNNMKGSRVLVTSRSWEVADYVRNYHRMSCLSNEEGWELFEKKVFCKERCPSLLEAPARQIVERCQGLPLAILTIGGILDKNSSLAEWDRVAEEPFLANNNLQIQSCHGVISLSYNQLYSDDLKNCFLYLAVFPRGHEVAAWKLIRLWIAEGFISTREDTEAEGYLNHLVDNHLLMVSKRKADGQIKTCRLHDTVHEFCKNEAANTNFFQEVDEARLDEVNKIPQRLCVHSSILDFLESKSKTNKPSPKPVCSFLPFCSQEIPIPNDPSTEHVSSFLSFCSQEIPIPNHHLPTIPKSFPLLRVIDVESIKFKFLPKELYHLYHLRYLAISTDQKLLDKLFNNKFEELQTLVFNTTQQSLEVEADIWSMPNLRHLKSNTAMQLLPPPSSSTGKIHTLSPVSPSSCTEEIFAKTPNIQNLGIRGNLVEHVESNGGIISLFDNLEKLDSLENLKLINEGNAGRKLLSFTGDENFPWRLRKMTLSNTGFDWKDFHILGWLRELKVLKLDDNAFMGEVWDVSNTVFRGLQYLRIGRTNLVSWMASKDSFCELEHLILKHCTRLSAIPLAFGEVESLKVVELFCTNTKAANSAREIQNLKTLVNDEEDAKKDGFQLSIYPPDH